MSNLMGPFMPLASSGIISTCHLKTGAMGREIEHRTKHEFFVVQHKFV
jgi:hypothetical protein